MITALALLWFQPLPDSRDTVLKRLGNSGFTLFAPGIHPAFQHHGEACLKIDEVIHHFVFRCNPGCLAARFYNQIPQGFKSLLERKCPPGLQSNPVEILMLSDMLQEKENQRVRERQIFRIAVERIAFQKLLMQKSSIRSSMS